MRYDRRVTFVRFGQAAYDPETGDYDRGQAVEASVPASIMDTRRETMQMVYGEIRQGSLTIQIQGSYDEAFNRILIDGTSYRVDYSRKLRSKQVFVVSEVQ